jgi:threonine dehydratase
VKIIGVEPHDACCLKAALDADERVILPEVGIFAEGVAVAQVGKRNFDIARQYVDEVITVSTDELCAAIKDIYDDTRCVSEPSGACAVAGMKKYVARDQIEDQTMVVLSSGANTNFDRLRHVAERAELGEHREALIAARIPERPGSFKQFCKALGPRNITEFNYRYESSDCARVFVGLTVSAGDEGVAELQQTLQRKGYQVLDMTDNETAKLHLRHLIGGRLSSDIQDEMVFRVEFPERPGSLLHFLTALGKDYSITLFHYRNHGAAYGRILVGMQVPSGKRASLRSALNRLGYRFWDETDNPAYREHLGRTTT